MTRKLAAILAADIAEFSRIMEADEEGALATLRGHRAAAETRISMHHGRIFGGAGDSIFAEFPSVLEAVACARAIQADLTARNRELSGPLRMQFRIGIHVGDVMIEGENLYGIGVNVAERIQGLAPPGAICLSEAAYMHVAAQPELVFEAFGTHRVKNIREPLRVYLLHSPDQAARADRQTRRGVAAGAVERHEHVAGHQHHLEPDEEVEQVASEKRTRDTQDHRMEERVIVHPLVLEIDERDGENE
jgi:class 3 adenylate cyclase